MPESPRFLVKKGNVDRATAVLARLYGKDESDEGVQKERQDIVNAVNYEAALGQASWKEMFTTMRRRSIISIMVQALAQLSGINIVTVRYIYTELFACEQEKINYIMVLLINLSLFLFS